MRMRHPLQIRKQRKKNVTQTQTMTTSTKKIYMSHTDNQSLAIKNSRIPLKEDSPKPKMKLSDKLYLTKNPPPEVYLRKPAHSFPTIRPKKLQRRHNIKALWPSLSIGNILIYINL
ncbi:hypothetical protein CsSME_00015486 [Camellia sinensis var. sinensis]